MFEAKDVKRGLKYYDQWGEFKVMAVADGYYMCRRPRCIPTIFAVKDLVNAINGDLLLTDCIAFSYFWSAGDICSLIKVFEVLSTEPH